VGKGACTSAGGPTNDTVYGYLSVRKPVGPGSQSNYMFRDYERDTSRASSGHVKHDENFFARGSCPGGNNPGWNCVAMATEVHGVDTAYVPYGGTGGLQTYERHSMGIPYREIYVWDPGHTNLYSLIASATGEASNMVNPGACTSEANSTGCSFSFGWGGVWTPNLSGTAQNGTDSSPSIYMGAVDNIQPYGGLSYKLDNDTAAQGTVGYSEQTRGCNQVWFRSNFTAQSLEEYTTGVNSYDNGPHPYSDTGATSPVTLDLTSAFIVRLYSGCGAHVPLSSPPPAAPNCGAPWNSCSVFEDHIYGKDSTGLPLGEVGVLIGNTPRVTGGTWKLNQGYLAVNTHCD
jgi:hypothetical protein